MRIKTEADEERHGKVITMGKKFRMACIAMRKDRVARDRGCDAQIECRRLPSPTGLVFYFRCRLTRGVMGAPSIDDNLHCEFVGR
jgi:hypothetical protein